jgi:hypothetical protein
VFAVAGVAVPFHREQGQLNAGGVLAVVNVHVYGAAMVLPHRSVACTDAVYVVLMANWPFGVKVATCPLWS